MSGLPSHLLGLLDPAAYPHAVRELRVIETHISWVILTGDYAYKLKRPVQYAFVDLRSPARREFLCAEEVRLNRRFAPSLYLGVSRIVATGGGLRVAEDGDAIEHAVRMRQFDRAEELDRLIESRGVDAGELECFGHDLAAIHESLPRVNDGAPWGSVDAVRAAILGNLAECLDLERTRGTAPRVEALAGMLRASLSRFESAIAARRAAVRECHGDLHARNLVRHEGRLVAFDCLEFEPAFRWIDVADEVAFLWMDLLSRNRADLAHAFVAGYLARSGDYGLCRLLRTYAAHRALVRAKVALLEGGAAAAERHRAYLDCARGALEPVAPTLILMSGLSGSGKTWLARQLAPALGALHMRSDIERKRMAGLDAGADSRSGLAQGLYSARSSARVYEHLAHCADAVLSAGFPVIVDATFARRAERAQFRELARRRGARLAVVQCTAPLTLLRSRIAERRERAMDASEADLAVLEWQLAHRDPIERAENLDVIEADTTRATVVSDVRAALRDAPPARRADTSPPGTALHAGDSP